MNLKRLIDRYGVKYLLKELIGVVHDEFIRKQDDYLKELFQNLSITLSKYKSRYNETEEKGENGEN